MESYDAWLELIKQNPHYGGICLKLKRLSITFFDVYERRNEVNIDAVAFCNQLDKIIDCVVQHQTHQITNLCEMILRNHQAHSHYCDLCPFTNCSFHIKGNPVLYVPKNMFLRVKQEFRQVISDIRGSFSCKCHGGVGQECCNYDCVVRAISTEHNTRLRPYIPEMNVYFDEHASEVYPVVPRIKYVRETETDVYFTLQVYTKKQARSMHIRIRNLLADLPWPHRYWKIVTTPRSDDNRTQFNRIFAADGKVKRFAGAVPKNAISLTEPKAFNIISRIEEYRTRWNLPSLQVKMIPCNLHRLYCLTCIEIVTADQSSRILRDLTNKSRK